MLAALRGAFAKPNGSITLTLTLSLQGRGNLLSPEELPPPLAGGGEGEGDKNRSIYTERLK